MQENRPLSEKLFIVFRSELKRRFRNTPALEKAVRRLLNYFPMLAVLYTRIALRVFKKPSALNSRVMSPRAAVILADLKASIATARKKRSS